MSKIIFSTVALWLALALSAAAIELGSVSTGTNISGLTVASGVTTNDDLIINHTNSGAGTWSTYRATVGTMLRGAAPLIRSLAPGEISTAASNTVLNLASNTALALVTASTNGLTPGGASLSAATTNAWRLDATNAALAIVQAATNDLPPGGATLSAAITNAWRLDATNAALAVIQTATNGRVLYVSMKGNDATAAVGNPALPYRTLYAAQSNAIAGDLVYVHPGRYTNSCLNASNVTWQFEYPVRLCNDPAADYQYLFADYSKALGDWQPTAIRCLGSFDFVHEKTGDGGIVFFGKSSRAEINGGALIGDATMAEALVMVDTGTEAIEAQLRLTCDTLSGWNFISMTGFELNARQITNAMIISYREDNTPGSNAVIRAGAMLRSSVFWSAQDNKRLDVYAPIWTGPAAGYPGDYQSISRGNLAVVNGGDLAIHGATLTAPPTGKGILVATSVHPSNGLGGPWTNAGNLFLDNVTFSGGSGPAVTNYQGGTVTVLGTFNTTNTISTPISGGKLYGNAAGLTNLDASSLTAGTLPSSRLPYKVYRGVLSQSGTAAPTVWVLENTLGTVTWARSDVGTYSATSTSLFTTGKTFATIGPSGAGAAINMLTLSDPGEIDIYSLSIAGEPTDGMIGGNAVEILVYP